MKKKRQKPNKLKVEEDDIITIFTHKILKKKRNKNKNHYKKSYFKISFIILLTLFLIITKFTKPTYFSNTTILLIGISKLDNNYIREWVEHYKSIGITKIILCDNNPTNEKKLSEPIKDYVDSNFVEVDESKRGKFHLQTDCYRKHFEHNHMK